VYQSAAILAALTFLSTDAVIVRISADPRHPVHAKIYRADYAITIGSSNLSENGMRMQLEANRRHEVLGEPDAFHEASRLAEQIWAQGRDYKAQLVALLQTLLSAVTWEEALARACAEILDGRWARRYTLADPLDGGPTLWPAQRQGVAQAMWLVDQVGSVLVADATGSGKTRMGAEILRAMVNRLWAGGRVRNHIPVIIAPPRVLEKSTRRRSWSGRTGAVAARGQLRDRVGTSSSPVPFTHDAEISMHHTSGLKPEPEPSSVGS
jgi:hypothetical protein